MQVVIDIPKDMYDEIKSGKDGYSNYVHNSIRNGTPQPKTGHWINTDSESFEFYRVYKCSECGNTEIEYPERICGHFRYCPNCGAKMESEE